MAISPQLPKVSYCIFCYNQSDYVEDALKAAFSQNYPNLEIIFSDDKSPDGSYEKAKAIAETYAGPHRVFVRQSAQNRGLIQHVNDVAAVAEGDVFVLTAGDDVSAPGRTCAVMTALAASRKGSAVYCDPWHFEGDIRWNEFCHQALTKNGPVRILSWHEVLKARGAIAPGALWAYHRSCFDAFGRLPSNLISEDSALPIRAALLGDILHLQAPLLAQRASPKSLNKDNQKYLSKGIVNILREHITQFDCMSADISTAVEHGYISVSDGKEMILMIEAYIEADLVADPVLRRRGKSIGLRDTLRDVLLLSAMGRFRQAASYLRGKC